MDYNGYSRNHYRSSLAAWEVFLINFEGAKIVGELI